MEPNQASPRLVPAKASASMKGLIKKEPANEEVGRTRDIKVELPTQEAGSTGSPLWLVGHRVEASSSTIASRACWAVVAWKHSELCRSLVTHSL